MSAGTALAVAIIAFVATNARPLALSLLGRSSGRVELAMDVLAAFGGAAIAALGALMLAGSFAPLHPLGY
jgi:hypothetical protein